MSPGLQVGMSGSLPAIKTSECLSPSKGQQQGMTPREGVQVHSYHKLFWRLNCTLEFNIFHHDDRNIYEVAAYNSEKDYEYEPIFLHAAEVMKLCAPPDLVTKEVEMATERLNKNRFSQKPSPDKMIETAKNGLFTKYIEAHLSPKHDGTISFEGLPGEDLDMDSIMYTPSKEEDAEDAVAEVTETSAASCDEDTGNVSLTELQGKQNKAKVTPSRRRTVVQRARSSVDDYNKALDSLHKDSQDLKQANLIAENMLRLSEMSVNAFKNALSNAGGKSKKAPEFYDKSKPLGRFRWAVHRIVLQNYVQAVTYRIDEINKKKSVRVNGTFPAPGSTDMQTQQGKIMSLAGRLSSNPQMKALSESLSRENTPSNSRKTSVVAHSTSLPAL